MSLGLRHDLSVVVRAQITQEGVGLVDRVYRCASARDDACQIEHFVVESLANSPRARAISRTAVEEMPR